MNEYSEIAVKSPAGAPDEVFRLTKCSDDLVKDENRELYDCINYTLFDVEELNANKILLNGFSAVNWTSLESISSYCKFYNSCVEDFCRQWQSGGTTPRFCQRQAKFHQLKYIMALCYNRAIEEPDRLNQYPPFSPQVYGETSFELIQQMVDSISISDEDTFIDLGSGVGQVVLQVAASTNVKFSYGIEKADYPAQCAVRMDKEFRRWMAFFGKTYQPYELVQGDFLADEYANVIENSTIVFANNFAFGPEVDYQLTLRFSRLNEGARVISSKSFCGRPIRMSDRRLGDLSSIMKLTLLDPVNDGVSWTDKPFSYFVHTIDRSPLLKYFNDLKNSRHGLRTKERKSGSSSSTPASTTSNSSDGSQAGSTAPSVCDSEMSRASQSQRRATSLGVRGRKRRRTAGRYQGGKMKRLSACGGNPPTNVFFSSSVSTLTEHDGDDDESTMDSAQLAPPPPPPALLKTEADDSSGGDTVCLTPSSSQCLSQPLSDLSNSPPSASASPSPFSCLPYGCALTSSVPVDLAFKAKSEQKTEPLLLPLSDSPSPPPWSLLYGDARERNPHRRRRHSSHCTLRRRPKLTKRAHLRQSIQMRHPEDSVEALDKVGHERKRRDQFVRDVSRLEETITSMHEEGRRLIDSFANKLGVLVATPAAFFTETRAVIRHHRQIELKILELREQLIQLIRFQEELLHRQLEIEAQLKRDHLDAEFEFDEGTEFRTPTAKRLHCPPQLFPETETVALSPPTLLPTDDDLPPPQLIIPSLPPRLTPISRVHTERTPSPSSSSSSSRGAEFCRSAGVLQPLSRRRYHSLDAVQVEEFRQCLHQTTTLANTSQSFTARIS